MPLPDLYQFSDVSHYETYLQQIVTGQQLASRGHRMAIAKASDNYHLPKKDGKYDFAAEIHFDAYFVDFIRSFREAGLTWLAYHFARFDRPLPVSNKAAIVQANLDYYLLALQKLVAAGVLTQAELDTLDAAVLDMEQSDSQLRDAGFVPVNEGGQGVSSMARQIVDLFLTRFDKLVFYSGSWWTDRWINKSTMEYIASKTTCWEPEYLTIGADFLPSGDKEWYFNNKLTVPHGYKKEFATSADDTIGKLFAWQYTDRALITVAGRQIGIDYNFTAMSKGELFKYTGQDGAVDPPGNGGTPTDPPDCSDAIQTAKLEVLNEMIERILAMKEDISTG